ncbi:MULTISPECIES: type II toxin-antitoxin system HicB family antitoxin [Bacillus]|uniref:type II toxin-antitoxin system HicB family antitoxin n=1 Tax=Bacillus TaxID=1386 RepID=UPI0023DF7DDA|nr:MULTISPECIES: type II toxin-antitoxin system HicB family antitoxin [Bacillus]MDF3254971.1 type II toxin-antitoxin system HicB family antitoxin [Bacillus velezensis]MDF3267800.1 type II toxin-antitoxin system HicB family antitoxin [Bacillus velezensis]
MPVYKYYGLFEPDEGAVAVSFPDLAGCLTFGDDFSEALECAKEALGGYLLVSEEDKDAIPTPSKAETIKVPEGASLVLVEVNTDDYRETV